MLCMKETTARLLPVGKEERGWKASRSLRGRRGFESGEGRGGTPVAEPVLERRAVICRGKM